MGNLCKYAWLSLSLLMFAPLTLVQGESSPTVLVFAHRSVPVSRLNADELRAIFRTDTRYWSDGKKIVPLNLPPQNKIRAEFDRAVLGMEFEAMTKFWIDRLIRGGSRAPRTVSSNSLAMKVVSRLPGSIGYATSADLPSGVKVLATVSNGRVMALRDARPLYAAATSDSEVSP
jgi:ABC-type phosphate transport system substrate-binding protein